MAGVDGTYETVVKSPMGDQKATLTVKSDGNSLTGQQIGAMGTADITNGTVDGNTISWSMSITVPMPMTLDCTATIDGDTRDRFGQGRRLWQLPDGRQAYLNPTRLRW